MHLELTPSPSQFDINIIRRGLVAYNLTHIPNLYQFTAGDFAVTMQENGQIVAGAICEIDWGWLYFDTVWTDASVRGKGYGSLIMQAAENYAVEHHTYQSYLFTTSFQARPFYEKIGYQLFGQVDDHPRGHTFYGLQKQSLQASTVDERITIDEPPRHERSMIVESGLLNAIAEVVPLNMRKLAVFFRNEAHEIKGGAIGLIFWDWFDLQLFWLDEDYRGQGIGGRMLNTLENELLKRQLIGIRCDTTSFQALPFYQANGFEIMGTLENRPPQHTSYFLKKRL